VFSAAVGASLTIHSSTITGNLASNVDGGIFSTGPLEVLHSTIVSNQSVNAGGGLRFGGTATLTHNIVAGNSSPAQPDIGTQGGGSFNVASYNLVGNGTGSGLTDGVNGNHVGTSGAPINPLLAPLRDNGGPTRTHYPLPGSPILDAGDPAFDGTGLTDQRGQPRVWSGRVDIGAVEFVPAGYALSLDGVNDYLILSNAALTLPTNEITIEFWEHVDTVRNQFSFILSPDDTTNRVSFSSVRANLTTYWDFGDLTNGGRATYATPSDVVSNWTHWALVSSSAGNAMQIYRNGVLDVSTATNRSFVNYAAALVLGARLDAGGQEFFKGELDEFRIWSVARTAAEIQTTMHTGLCAPQSNLWVYWKFDEGSGTTVFDHSGNGRDATLVNGASRSPSFAPLSAPGTLTILRDSLTQVRLLWSPNSGCLQSAPDLTGPWTEIPGATNGEVIGITAARQFFRITQ
jgi:hypothetical protein